jgi:hypothetical protein
LWFGAGNGEGACNPATPLRAGKLDPQMITVPACPECNDEKKHDDEYIRDMFARDVRLQPHPLVARLRTTTVARAAARNQSEFERELNTGARRIPLRLPSGLIIPHPDLVRYEVSNERIQRICERIVRGLYYAARKKKRLPHDYQFLVLDVPQDEVDTFMAFFNDFGFSGFRALGNSQEPGDVVFEFVYLYALQDEHFTVWVLCFYETRFFFLATLPRGYTFEAYFNRLRGEA